MQLGRPDRCHLGVMLRSGPCGWTRGPLSDTRSMARPRAKAVKAGRRAVARGEHPRYRVELDDRVVPDMPWLDFDGDRPAAVAEAARRAIAAELAVRPDQVEVEPVELSPAAMGAQRLERDTALLDEVASETRSKLEESRDVIDAARSVLRRD